MDNDYKLISLLGGGVFRQTYLAEKRSDNSQCIVKRIKPLSSDPDTLQAAASLLRNEAEVLFRLGTHDQIPELLHEFCANQEFYLVQEFIAGDPLDQELARQKKLSEQEVIALLQESLEILKFFHQEYGPHLNISPSSFIRRASDGKLVLIDFGSVHQAQLSSIGNLGTPGYTPQRQDQEEQGFYTDIYAVGTIAIQALTGIDPEQLLPTSQSSWRERAQVSDQLVNILDKMVHSYFRTRYQSATEALEHINQLSISLPSTIRPTPRTSPGLPIMASAATLVVVVVSFIIVTLTNILPTVPTDSLVKEGDELLNSGDYEKAIEFYQQALAINPKLAQALTKQGDALAKLGQYVEAIDLYEQALAVDPILYEVLTKKGDVQVKLGQYVKAIEDFEKAIQINPDYQNAQDKKERLLDALNFYEEGMDQLNSRNWQKAIDAFNKTLIRMPEFIEAWTSIGYAYGQFKPPKQQEKLAACERAVEIDPKDIIALNCKALALHNLRRYPEAISIYNLIIDSKPDSPELSFIWNNRGQTKLKAGFFREALADFEQAIKFKPNYLFPWNNKGFTHEKLNEYQSALDAYNKALEIKPDYAPAIQGKDRMKRKLGQ